MASTSSTTQPPVQLYNTESKTLEIFTPLSPHRPVRMYTCGPTVYDYAHVGNFRSFIFADVLKRTLQFNGYTLKHTINFTDFGHLTDDGDAGEDKMLKGLKREGLPITLEAMRTLSDRYIDAFKVDAEELRIATPDTWSRASDFVHEQIQLIKTLDQKGYVYETSDGVYFDISTFPTYGRLGNIDLDEVRSGARVDINPEKRHPADFAVWKKALLGWNSPWGKGFPGWHVECSAMAIATLGRQIDIHTGGIDHIHTHHNAEIAQSEAATGKPFVRYWLHNAFITIDETKVAKSLGNAITLHNLHEHGFSGDEYRYWLLTAHYRSPINFTFEALQNAKHALYRLKRHVYEEYGTKVGTPDAATLSEFTAAINNDLDTPRAIACLWDLVRSDHVSNPDKLATIRRIDTVLGIGLNDSPEAGARSLGVISQTEIPEAVRELIEARETARSERNWEEADHLREAVNLHGYLLEDTKDGPKLSKL